MHSALPKSCVPFVLLSFLFSLYDSDNQLFGDHPPERCYFHTEPDVAEWDYGAYEGMLSKDIAKDKPDWSIWDDGCVDPTAR